LFHIKNTADKFTHSLSITAQNTVKLNAKDDFLFLQKASTVHEINMNSNRHT